MAKKKDDFNKIQHRIKKHPVGNAWLQNVAKSMKVTTFDVVTDLMPNTADFLQYNTSDTIDMVRSMRTNMGSRQMINNQFKNIPQIRAANDALKNAMKDIKSGNLNNKAREQEFDFDDMDYGFGMFDENDKLEFIDDDENKKNNKITLVLNVNETPTIIDEDFCNEIEKKFEKSSYIAQVGAPQKSLVYLGDSNSFSVLSH